MSLDRHQVLSLFPCNTKPYGFTYEQWTEKWWCWLLDIPKDISPASDETGNYAHINQNDKHVFFLCQTFEQTNSVPTRRVLIQRGKSLLFPLINWISVAPEDGETDQDLRLKARNKMNTIQNLLINVDGHEIRSGFEGFRIQSHPFYVELPKCNILNLNPGFRKVVSDGYWIFTHPIVRSISLTTFGSCTSGLTRIGVIYNISVT
jgi:hypothetical protein